MYKIRRSLSWFDKNFKTKDDMQFMLLILLVAFIVFTKCYMATIHKENIKQTVNVELAGKEITTSPNR